MKITTLHVICISLLAIALSGCGLKAMSGSAVIPPDAPVKDVHINAFNFGFTQDPVTIHKGDHVHLVVSSSEGTHGLMIPDLGIATDEVSPGQEQVVDFVADKAGTFDYFCDVPCGSGHRSMRGQLVVEP